MASVEKALRMSNGDFYEWPVDELLPVEPGAVASNKHQSSGLVAVQTLVSSFVLMHNRLVSQLASAHDQSRQLQQEVEYLKLELCPVIAPPD